MDRVDVIEEDVGQRLRRCWRLYRGRCRDLRRGLLRRVQLYLHPSTAMPPPVCAAAARSVSHVKKSIGLGGWPMGCAWRRRAMCYATPEFR